MARRTSRRGNGGWWIVVALIAAALALWWMWARHVEAPVHPVVTHGDTAPEEGVRGGGGTPDGDAEEITPPERQELDRVLRERGGTPAR